eukprot:4532625-Lingulodinium_polyedra.AAC.1
MTVRRKGRFLTPSLGKNPDGSPGPGVEVLTQRSQTQGLAQPLLILVGEELANNNRKDGQNVDR